MPQMNANLRGVSYLLLAMLINSLQSVAVKWIGGSYSVLEIVAVRSVVALPITLLLFRLEGGRGWPTTPQRKLQIVRGLFLFLSYTTYMMGLAALPLADIEALRFSGPLMITVLSVLMLSEKVESRRWLALLIGFSGVWLIVNPGSATFNEGSIFVLVSVVFYALNVILTRRLRKTDSSATMAFYSTLIYLLGVLVVTPLTAAVGEVPSAHPSLAFLFHAWVMPTGLDLVIMAGLGVIWAGWMYFMTRAYSVGQTSVVAPFEYASLPISIMWGFLIWRDVPTTMTLAGAALTLLSGLYILNRERTVTAGIARGRNEQAKIEA